MRKQIYILSTLLALIIYGCKYKEDVTQVKKISLSKLYEKHFDSLLIEGNNIWVRQIPKKGKLLMILNEGDKCAIIDTGKIDTIRGSVDYWYQINYKDTIGWVFGSQTNIKSQSSIETRLFLEKNREKLMCSNINFKFIAGEENFLSSLIILSNLTVLDTVNGLSEKKIRLADNKTISVKIKDYNFDNLCDFIIIDSESASHGTMGHYYYLYDLTTKKFKEDKSLPQRTPGVEIDKTNKKIIVYCSYKDCKGSYKFIDNKFKLVDGEYTNEP